MYKIVQNISNFKSLDQLISSIFVFHLHLSTYSLKNFP